MFKIAAVVAGAVMALFNPFIPFAGEMGLANQSKETPSVTIVGDSITFAAAEHFEDEFSEVIAQNGKRIADDDGDNESGVEILTRETLEHPESDHIWVIALGTGDISKILDTGEVASAVDALLAPIPDGAPVIWVNTYFGDRPEDTAVVNDAIDQVVLDRPNSTVARWSDIAATEGPDGSSYLSGDLVHPTTEGSAVFADFVIDATTAFTAGTS